MAQAVKEFTKKKCRRAFILLSKGGKDQAWIGQYRILRMRACTFKEQAVAVAKG